MSQEVENKKKDYTLFAQEEEVICQASDMVGKLEEVAGGVRGLAEAYDRQYREQQKLLRLSDRIQLELHKANQRLADQAEELKALNAALTLEIEQRKKLEDELRLLATTDSLTGLLTRRRFLELGHRELLRKARNGSPLSILLMDLDHFKRVNDRFGHAAGDQVLAAMAKVGRAGLREVDLLGRLGGEEFGAVLPDAGLETARQVAERLREALAGWKYQQEAHEVTVTVSIGITEVTPDDKTLDTAFSRADKALYRAKATGRNRGVAWEDLTPSEQS